MRFFSSFRTIALTGAAALALAGCGGDATGGASASEPLAKISAPAGKSWSQTVVATENGMLMGNPNAPLKLVEFASFTCSHCADFSKASAEEIKRDFVDTGRVSYELRPFIRDPLDLMAATTALCVGPERFFPLADNMFASQEGLIAGAQGNPAAAQNIGALPERDRFTTLARAWQLDQFFAARGIPAAELDRCLSDSAAINKHSKATEDAAKQYEITGTPTFLLNGSVMADVAEWPKMRAALQAAGAR